ncbi:serine/threonine-protein kinase spk-1-like isoform X2 [Canna indica]|uniref:Serine/threonine-protein kinase spk-1-like isoform X2 n=1 Tax=Canna indica TaxID=4628 RepID=A0AAQ3KRY7_9LILI|nr:serine/threonine-protein kinase spk-1-like isoform X2 [Canna indica]
MIATTAVEKKQSAEAEGEMWAPTAAAAGGISGEEAVSARLCRSSSFPQATNASFLLSLSTPKMNGGKARVSQRACGGRSKTSRRSASVRQTIQNIKEIARTVDGEVQDSEGVGLQVEDDITDEVHLYNSPEDQLEVFDLRIIHRKNRTGCEEHKEFPIVLKSIVAGRYYIMKYLGSAAFSEVVQAHDLHTRMDVCLKIIKNDKDFFDQSLDEIKLLKYVNKHDPSDEHCAFMTTSIIRSVPSIFIYYLQHIVKHWMLCLLKVSPNHSHVMMDKDANSEMDSET